MAKLHEVEVVVQGNRQFPIDMLRYDGLCPAQEADSYAIARSLADDEVIEASVLLRRWAEQHWKPTAGRWSSFGWRVVRHAVTGRTL